MHLLVELHGQPGWLAALTPLSVDGMIVAASTTLSADSRSGGRTGFLPWALLVAGSASSLAANVAVSGADGHWPHHRGLAVVFADRRIRVADAPGQARCCDTFAHKVIAAARPGSGRGPGRRQRTCQNRLSCREVLPRLGAGRPGQNARLEAWLWARDNRAEDGALPSGREIGTRHGRHERWGRMVKQSGLAREIGA